MQATVGDRLHVHGRGVGDPDKLGEIVEVHGKAGEPPYLVRFDDGHTGLVFPGPDAVIEHPRRRQRARTAPGGQGATAGTAGKETGRPARHGRSATRRAR